MLITMNNLNEINDIINTREIMLIKFDNKESNYNQFIDRLDLKVINITDEEIINFYDIEVLPTILVYKDKKLIESIKGFNSKTTLTKKILDIIENHNNTT